MTDLQRVIWRLFLRALQENDSEAMTALTTAMTAKQGMGE